MARDKRLILFVEDSQTQALSVQFMLEKTGRFDVTLANNAMDALELLQEDPLPDAIITDIVMPEITGFELTAAIRTDERLQEIPVLLTTSKSSQENMLESLKCGANSFIPKPLTESLVSLLDYIIDNHELREDSNSDEVVMKVADQTHEISGSKAHIIDMLYSTIIVAQDKSLKLEECFKELKEVKSSLRELPKKHHSETPSKKSDNRNIKILIVDDTDINRMICSRLLASLGYDHEVAENAQQVINMVKARYNDFDLIFSDCQMPEMDGFEMTRRIRTYEKDHNYKQKPIIALTANVHEEDQNLCYDAGMNDFLSKPFRKNDIDNCIKKWINKI
jgi:CheY-like chemotaxis protein